MSDFLGPNRRILANLAVDRPGKLAPPIDLPGPEYVAAYWEYINELPYDHALKMAVRTSICLALRALRRMARVDDLVDADGEMVNAGGLDDAGDKWVVNPALVASIRLQELYTKHCRAAKLFGAQHNQSLAAAAKIEEPFRSGRAQHDPLMAVGLNS